MFTKKQFLLILALVSSSASLVNAYIPTSDEDPSTYQPTTAPLPK